MFKKLVIAVVLFAILGIGVLIWGDSVYNEPGSYTEQKHIIIKKGSGVSSILSQLADEGVIDNALLMRFMTKLKGDGNFRFGEYLFEPGLSPAQVFEKLTEGSVVVRKITIPEGKTVYEIIEIINKSEGLSGELPKEIPEGSILPQTYYYQWGDSYEQVIGQMQKAMKQVVDSLWEFRRMDIPITTKEEAVILASIVEKETGGADERPLVASVFINRLKKGMPLQSDPTSIYGITAGAPLGRLPSGADMKDDNPYNTYRIPALPPGPICNPGTDSIEAVLNPPDTSYLFFVADGMGGHNFSTGLADHNRNVNEYREVVREYRKGLSNRQKSEMIIKPR